MKYNANQLAAIHSTSPKVIITAGAGTGKTSTLIASVKQYIQDNNAKQNVLLLTFTNKAAEEMRERLNLDIGFVGTIHSFAIDTLKQLAYEYNFRLRFLTHPMIITILNELYEKNGYGDMSYTCEMCYQYIMNKGAFLKNPNNRTLPIFSLIEERYIKFKREKNMFDYTDAPYYLLQKLDDYDIHLSYDAIFIDEGQDLSPDQVELFITDNWITAEKKLVIGDEKQSIYLFRGASPEVFNGIKDMGYKPYYLSLNYRSYQEILNYSHSGLIANRGAGGVIHKSLETIMRKSPQILCRTNEEVFEIEKFYPFISTIHAAKGLEFDDVVVSDFFPFCDEDKNIKYVALTRAKNSLGVFPFEEILKFVKRFCNKIGN